jgi:RecB family exonuclease
MSLPLLTGRFPDLSRHLAERVAHSGGAVPFGVLVPSRAAAQGIVKAVLELIPQGIANLQLYTLENLARRIVNSTGELPPVAADLERRLAMRQAARSIDDATIPLLGLEAILDRSYRDVRDAGVQMHDLEARRFRRAPRHELLFRALRQYRENVRAMGLIELPDLLQRAAILARSGQATDLPQVLFGFYDMTGVQMELASAIASAGRLDSVYVPLSDPLHRDYAFAAPFLEACRSRLGTGEPAPMSSPIDTRQSFSCYTTRRDEIRSICSEVSRLIAGRVPPSEIGIVCRSADPIETAAFTRSAAEEGFGLGARRELPLRGQRIGRAVQRLLRIRQAGIPRSWVIELLRDGLLVESVRGSSAIDHLDRLTRRQGIAGGDAAVVTAAIEGLRTRDAEAAEKLGSYAAVTAEIEEMTAGFASSTSRGQGDVLRGLLGRFRPETAEDLAAFDLLEEVASTLDAGAVLGVAGDAETAAELIENCVIPLRQPEGPAVWFGDLMTIRGRSFRHLFAYAVEEDRLPQGRSPDPLLTDPDRASLGLPQIGDGRAEEALLFRMLLDSAEDLHLSWAASDGYGKVLRPSPLIASAARGVRAERAPAPSPPAALTPHLQRQLALMAGAGGAGEYDGYIDVDEAMQLEIRRRLEIISPTMFEDFGECPQKFLFRRLLFADELQDPEHEAQINHLEKGSLDHRILERFYREAADRIAFFSPHLQARLPEDLGALLERVVGEEFDRFDTERPPFNEVIRQMERRLTRRNLERFLLRDLEDLHESGFRPLHFEYTFGTDRHGEPDYPHPVAIEIGNVPVAFRGVIDRVDRTVSRPHRLRVVDYKSGKAGRYRNLAELIDVGQRLQLVIYAIAAEQIFGLPPEAISGAIKPLGDPDGGSETFAFELAEHKDRLLGALETFIGAILEGRFPALPTRAGCQYCPLSSACRTTHSTEERRRLRHFDNALELLGGGEA